MRLIRPKAELLIQPSGLEGVYKQIERCARTCYKSEDNSDGTVEGAKAFVDKMIKSGHTAMLEHGTVYLAALEPWNALDYQCITKYIHNNYSKVIGPVYTKEQYAEGERQYSIAYVTTNLRVLVENGWLDDLKYLDDPLKYHEKRYTFRLTTDRGVSHELVRHRAMSFSQESSRFCNYSKNKFSNELTFIIPSWATAMVEGRYDDSLAHDSYWHNTDGGESLKVDGREACLMGVMSKAEQCYMDSLERGCTPQQARQMLPNAISTEICMTGFASDWRHFFDLRLFGKTGKPHPDMYYLALLMKMECEKHDIWEDIMNQPSKFK